MIFLSQFTLGNICLRCALIYNGYISFGSHTHSWYINHNNLKLFASCTFMYNILASILDEQNGIEKVMWMWGGKLAHCHTGAALSHPPRVYWCIYVLLRGLFGRSMCAWWKLVDSCDLKQLRIHTVEWKLFNTHTVHIQ